MTRNLRFALAGWSVLMTSIAAGAAEPTQSKFYKAYYAETAERDYQSAADLYAEIVRDRNADPDIRNRARTRLAAVRDDLAVRDFAKLMPPNAFAYLEITQPADQLMSLLSQVGLLADGELPATDSGRRLAISPDLIREALGIRGAAVAVTGFDPRRGPSGVLVFHHGNVEVIRGLIETGLPAGATLVDPAGGYPTYNVEGEVFVTLTPRLIIASPDRAQIDGVLARLKGDTTVSLADSDTLSTYADEREHSLLFFTINAKPILPMLKGMMAAGAEMKELAIADALIDLDSLQSLVGNVRVGDDGLGLELALRLDEGHRSLVYNFLRTPAVDKNTLQCVPAGAAAFLVGALNESPSHFADVKHRDADAQQVVTALDIGREVFANITSFSLYAAALEPGGAGGGPPIPDVGLVLRVNDPSKSEALWTQILGIASLASGGGAIEGNATTVEGVDVRSFTFPGGVAVYFGTVEHDVIIGGSKSAIARSITARRTDRSVLSDDAFAKALQDLTPKSTKGIFVHAGRVAQIARPFIQGSDAAELDKIMGKLSDTVLALTVEHSERVFRLSANLNGLPQLGDLVAETLDAEAEKQKLRQQLAHAKRAGDWNKALAIIDTAMNEHPGSAHLLRSKFDVLATGIGNRAAATTAGQALVEALHNDATRLNNFAWALLTEDRYQGDYAELALRASQRSNEITDRNNWMFLDTLALAEFETGHTSEAIELQKKAMAKSGGAGMKDMKIALARYESAMSNPALANSDP